MSGSCRLDKPWNVEICAECQIFVIVILFNHAWVMQFGTPSSLELRRPYVLLLNSILMAVEKKSKQTFNTKFIIFRSVQTRHKGQIVSEWLFGVQIFPKKQSINLKDFCPRI